MTGIMLSKHAKALIVAAQLEEAQRHIEFLDATIARLLAAGTFTRTEPTSQDGLEYDRICTVCAGRHDKHATDCPVGRYQAKE